ncbi:GGDEF domain-containing protein [Sphingomonas silueang]|jgi:diguanylate cyclase|uniref:GGDEF domain-containing protein n=2 Tax=Bacteria TaxID=2 RepID=UPI0028E509EF|nr:diguanylate cyclase [uncultured Sphingomonas sp.]
MTGRRSKTRSGVAVLKFLDAHQLEHTPGHYAFAHRYLHGRDAMFRSRVDELIDGGVRLTERQVASLAPAPAVDAPANDRLLPEIERISLGILAVMTAASGEASALTRELTLAAIELAEGDVQTVRAIVMRMLAQSRSAEESFAAVSSRTRALHDDLLAILDVVEQDPATGALSHDAVLDRLAMTLASERQHVSVAMFNLDRFAHVEASHGQAVAVRLLRVLVTTLAEQCRPSAIGRAGDHRLLAVFRDMPAHKLIARLDAARQAFADRRMKVRESDVELGMMTFSAGIAQARSRTVDELIGAVAILAARAGADGDVIVSEPPVVEIR